jgi:hypothetical protein
LIVERFLAAVLVAAVALAALALVRRARDGAAYALAARLTALARGQ